MNDTAGQPCSEKVIDYVTAQWRLISIRKNIDGLHELRLGCLADHAHYAAHNQRFTESGGGTQATRAGSDFKLHAVQYFRTAPPSRSHVVFRKTDFRSD